MQAQWREEHTEGKIHHSFAPLAPRDTCPSCVDESAYIFWQLWAKGFVKRNHSYCFDWSPLVRLEAQNAFKCDCATASESKARTYRTSKRKTPAIYLPGTIIWHRGTLPGLASTLEQAALSVIAGSGPLAGWSIRRLGSRWMTFKLANSDGHANQSGSGLPFTVRPEDFAQSEWMCSCSGCVSTLPLRARAPG